MGNLLTNISLGKASVSFTHTIKAMEPFFTVLLSALFLAEVRFLILFYVLPLGCYVLSSRILIELCGKLIYEIIT